MKCDGCGQERNVKLAIFEEAHLSAFLCYDCYLYNPEYSDFIADFDDGVEQ